jgi:hypothetical protein
MTRRRGTITDWLPRPENEVAGALEYTRLVREQCDRQVFFGVLSVAALVVALPMSLASAGAGAVLLLVGVIGVLACVGTVVIWRRRYRAVRVTSWREAKATIGRVAPTTSSTTRGPLVAVAFADGSRIDVRTTDGGWAVRALSELPDLPVLVGGHGSAMALLVLPRPPWWTRPRVFAAKAETYRWTPDA